MAPENGVLMTPVWVGIHDGNFDLYGKQPVCFMLQASIFSCVMVSYTSHF